MISRVSFLDMTPEEWNEQRRKSIGGSDAGTIVGLNAYKSPYALWAEKTGAIIPEDISDKEAVRLGHDLEHYVAERFMEATGKKLRRDNNFVYNTDFPFAHVQADRIVVGENAGFEAKTTSSYDVLKRLRDGNYLDTWYAQCVHGMMVTGAERWYLGVLCFGHGFYHFTIERDEEEIAALASAEADFWEKVQTNTPPAVDGSQATAEAIGAIYQADEAQPEVDLTPVCGSLREYLALKEQVKALESRMEAAANAVKEYMGSATRGSYEGMTVKWSQVTSQRFDKAAFQKNNPGIDLSGYHKATVSRRFEVKENT